MTVFIHKGDAPLSIRQATTRGRRLFEAQRMQWAREQGIVTNDPTYLAWAMEWVENNRANGVNNTFNHQLAAYRAAVARLAQYRLAEGRPEITENQPTGEFDPDTGEPVMVTVVVQTALDPLPPEVERDVYDPDTGEVTGTEIVPNPAIVDDDTARAEAGALIEMTPQEVKDFDAA